MTSRPRALERVESYFAAAMIAHEYVADLHQELVALGGSDDYTTDLVRESAEVVTRRMPGLTKKIRELARTWEEQELLDPIRADATHADIDAELTALEPELSGLRARQDEIAAVLREHVERARRR